MKNLEPGPKKRICDSSGTRAQKPPAPSSLVSSKPVRESDGGGGRRGRRLDAVGWWPCPCPPPGWGREIRSCGRVTAAQLRWAKIEFPGKACMGRFSRTSLVGGLSSQTSLSGRGAGLGGGEAFRENVKPRREQRGGGQVALWSGLLGASRDDSRVVGSWAAESDGRVGGIVSKSGSPPPPTPR